MKKSVVGCALAVVLLLLCVMSVYAWTGKMAGMGNPYGLIEDESSFLTHPSAMPLDKGLHYYGSFGINYNKITKWDYSAYYNNMRSFEAHGSNWNADASTGFTAPVAGGRLGVFLQYSGDILKRGTYSGSVYQPEFSNLYADIDLSEKYDNFALRALYAKALTNKFKLGGEVSLSHVKEINELARVSYYSDMSVSNETVNQPAGANFSYLYAYMLPRDSRYWETNLKASLETNLDPVKLDFSVFGGFIFDGDDKYDWRNGGNYLNQDGNIKGSKFGGELWLRLPVDDTLSIPLLLKAVYSKKTHRGDGFGNQGFTGSYDGSDRSKYFEFGAGLDKKFGKGGFATGLYYSFLDTQATLDYATSDGGHYYYAPYPNFIEKRLTLKFAGEADVSSKFSLNGGLAFYYGWIDQQFTRDSSSYGLEDISNNGDIWGIGASLGTTVKLNGFTIEPYAKAGYSKLRLTGDGVTFYPLSSSDYKKNQWNVGGGFALRF